MPVYEGFLRTWSHRALQDQPLLGWDWRHSSTRFHRVERDLERRIDRKICRDPWTGVMGHRRWQGGGVAPSPKHEGAPDRSITIGSSKSGSRKQDNSLRF